MPTKPISFVAFVMGMWALSHLRCSPGSTRPPKRLLQSPQPLARAHLSLHRTDLAAAESPMCCTLYCGIALSEERPYRLRSAEADKFGPRTDQQPTACNGRSGDDAIVEPVFCQNFEFFVSSQNNHSTIFASDIDLAITTDGRSKIFTDVLDASQVPERFSVGGVKTAGDAPAFDNKHTIFKHQW